MEFNIFSEISLELFTLFSKDFRENKFVLNYYKFYGEANINTVVLLFSKFNIFQISFLYLYFTIYYLGSSCVEESLNETKEGRHLKKM